MTQLDTKPYSYKRIGDHYAVSIANHAELFGALEAFANDEMITAGTITGLGAVDRATLRFYDPDTKEYVDRTFEEQMEIANLTGNLSTLDGAPYLHLHIVLGRTDYTALAGHLLTAHIHGACEVFVTSLIGELPRYHDDSTGLKMLDLR